ncbi:hypothetical protein L4D00_15070 [Photobacterium swingsii]|uniref:hypothetical protein n=1 Tax=Photobacterium swingsii TaxID=680026 RepID=UPI003D0F7188
MSNTFEERESFKHKQNIQKELNMNITKSQSNIVRSLDTNIIADLVDQFVYLDNANECDIREAVIAELQQMGYAISISDKRAINYEINSRRR